nr:MAG TPA: hypothetical protein [Caudoviricetes sp.]
MICQRIYQFIYLFHWLFSSLLTLHAVHKNAIQKNCCRKTAYVTKIIFHYYSNDQYYHHGYDSF